MNGYIYIGESPAGGGIRAGMTWHNGNAPQQQTEAEQLLEWAKTCRIRVQGLPHLVSELHRLAVKDAHSRIESRIVAFVRHRYTNYDNLCIYLRSQPVQSSPMLASDIINERVNERVLIAMDRLYGPAWREWRK